MLIWAEIGSQKLTFGAKITITQKLVNNNYYNSTLSIRCVTECIEQVDIVAESESLRERIEKQIRIVCK